MRLGTVTSTALKKRLIRYCLPLIKQQHVFLIAVSLMLFCRDFQCVQYINKIDLIDTFAYLLQIEYKNNKLTLYWLSMMLHCKGRTSLCP